MSAEPSGAFPPLKLLYEERERIRQQRPITAQETEFETKCQQWGGEIQALQNQEIAGAALDVFELEPLPENSPLRMLENSLLQQILQVLCACFDILLGDSRVGAVRPGGFGHQLHQADGALG